MKNLKEMKRSLLIKELENSRKLISEVYLHIVDAVAFYGYSASVEDLIETNYALQRKMKVFLEQPSRDTLIKWIENLFEQIMHKNHIAPGQDITIDKIALFLKDPIWEKQEKERLGNE